MPAVLWKILPKSGLMAKFRSLQGSYLLGYIVNSCYLTEDMCNRHPIK